MSRLPQPGGDRNSWGEILNDFLQTAHTSVGALKDDIVGTNHIQSGAVTNTKISAVDAGKVTTGTFTIPRIPDLKDIYVGQGAHVIDPRISAYGAKGDARRISTVTSTSGSPSVTVPGGSFVTADVGKLVVVATDFSTGTITTIQSVQSATQITLAVNAGLTLSGTGYIYYGTDDSAAIQAALNAAEAGHDVDNTTGPNSPSGLGFTTVHLPTPANVQGGYMLRNQLAVPAGVCLDSQAFIFNMLADRYNPCIAFESYSRAGILRVDCLQGAGIVAGDGVGIHADFHAEQLMIWHAGRGTESTGLLRKQDAIVLQGYGFLIDVIWVKGGTRAVYHNAGSDCTINRAHVIGARTGIQFWASNQVWYGTILLDTVGTVSGGTNGINIDNQCSNVDLNVQAFIIVGNSEVIDNVVAVGSQAPSGLNRLISIRVQAALTGGAVLYLKDAQDVTYNVSASNNAAQSFGGTNITTAVVFGGNNSGYTNGEARMSGTVTPYSGSVPGPFTYYRTGVRYHVQGGSTPTTTVLGANGTTPAAITVTGNDSRGRVSFGSGASPASGSQLTVNFVSTTAYIATPVIVISAMSSATAALQPYVAAITTSGFNIGFAIAPTASQSAGTYVVSYRIES